MKRTIKILTYNFFDVLRSRWTLFYVSFFLLSAFGLIYFSSNLNSAMVSLMNIVIAIIPLIATIFGIMYYYNSREFAELLLTQPVKRSNVFMGQYLGLSLALALSFTVGLLIPFIYYGVQYSGEVWNFLILIITGIALTFIFTAIAFFIAVLNDDKIKGFGLAILVWLFFAVIYDGLLLVVLVLFQDYPLENPVIAMSLFNPVDLSRVLVLLKLDISALMGYTGAVFNKFFGTQLGMTISFGALLIWIIFPVTGFIFKSNRKDF